MHWGVFAISAAHLYLPKLLWRGPTPVRLVKELILILLIKKTINLKTVYILISDVFFFIKNVWATIMPFEPVTNFLLTQIFFPAQPFQALLKGEPLPKFFWRRGLQWRGLHLLFFYRSYQVLLTDVVIMHRWASSLSFLYLLWFTFPLNWSLTRLGTFNPTYHNDLLNLMIFINCTCMFTSANYQLIRSNCTDSNIHGNKKSVPSRRSKCDNNLEIVIY
jgi:hypothetical protein